MTTPAPLPPKPAGLAIVAVSGATGTGDIRANVWSVNLGATALNAETLASRFLAFYQAVALSNNFFPFGWLLNNISIQSGGPSSQTRVDRPQSLGPGAGGGESAPPQVAVVASHQTAFIGPRYRGRTYLGPVGVNIIQDGTILTSARSSIVAEANVLRTNLQTDGTPLVVWSRTGGFMTPVTGTNVGPTFDTQRSRRSALRG